jgi:hypothetical protein
MRLQSKWNARAAVLAALAAVFQAGSIWLELLAKP